MIRTFIGIEVDEGTRAHLAEEIAYLKSIAPHVKWVKPDNLHLTLKFLGNLPADDLREVFDAVTLAAAKTEPFTLQVRDLGCFPDPRHMRTVWAGCAGGVPEMIAFARTLDDTLAEMGFPPEKRPYHPHVTLGRVKMPKDAADLPPAFEDATGAEYGEIDVDNLVVFMSELKRGGSIYTPMYHAPLGSQP